MNIKHPISGSYCSSQGVFCEYSNEYGFCTLSCCKFITTLSIVENPIPFTGELEARIALLEEKVKALVVSDKSTMISQIAVADQGNRVRIPMDFFRAAGINPLEPVLISMDINDKTIKLSAIRKEDVEKAKGLVCKLHK